MELIRPVQCSFSLIIHQLKLMIHRVYIDIQSQSFYSNEFKNYEPQEFKLVERKEYEAVMGKIDYTHTPTQAEVNRM
jgi:hypothetical protein